MNAPVDYSKDLIEEQEFRLTDYLQIVKRRKRTFWLTCGLILALAIGTVMVLPPVYRSSALVLVQQQELTTGLLGSALSEQADQSVEYLVRSIMKDETLAAVVKKYNLFSEHSDNVTEGQIIAKMESSINVRIVNPELMSSRARRPGQDEQVAFEISFDYQRDPEIAQQVTSELVRLFMDENLAKRKQITEETTAFLRDQADLVKTKIEDIEERLTAFKQQNNGLLPAQIAVIINERERTERELISVDQQISAARSSSLQLQGQLAGTEAYIYEDRTLIRNDEGERVLSATGRLQTLQQQYHSLISKYSTSHPKVRKIKNEIESLGGNVSAVGASPLTNDELEIAQTDLAEARLKYSSNHPTVKRLEAKVERLRSQANTVTSASTNAKDFNSLRRVNPAFSSLKAGVARSQSEIESLVERKADLQAKLDEYAEKLVGAPGVEKDFTRLERENEDALREYRDLQQKLVTAERAEALEVQQKGDRFSLLEPANLPRGPIKPNRPAILILGSLIAVGLGLGLVMLREALDESITSSRALVSLIGAQPLGTIPLILETSEQESMQRRGVRRFLLMMIVFAAIIGAVYWVHTSVMPLQEILAKVTRRIQLLTF